LPPHSISSEFFPCIIEKKAYLCYNKMMIIFLSNLIAAACCIIVFLMLVTVVVNLFIPVPFVPSNKRVIDRVLEIAHLKKDEKVYDLGCGDGRFLIEAEKKARVKAVGFEAAPIPLILAYIRKWINGSHIKIHMGNFFKTNLADADVIFCYLGPETLQALCPKLKSECRKGTRIYSHTFHIEGMRPTAVWEKDPAKKLPKIYYYET
jgi:SAM-dependent methyltransferase